MTRIQFKTGDTLGGTAPLSLMGGIKPHRARISRTKQRRRRLRRFCLISLALAVGAAFALYLG